MNPTELEAELELRDEVNGSGASTLAGNFVGFAMYGVTVYQMYRYFRLYPRESRGQKLLILALLVMDTLHMIESSHMCYYYLIRDYLNPKALLGTWSSRGVIVFLTQGFYIRRLYILNIYHSRIVIALAPFMFAELGLSIAGGVEMFELATFFRWRNKLWLDMASLAIAVVIDIILATTLVVVLYRSRAISLSMHSVLETIICYTVNTCVLTSVLNVAVLVLMYVLGKHSIVYLGLVVPATRSYPAAVVAVLNSRKSVAERNFVDMELREVTVESDALKNSDRKGVVPIA